MGDREVILARELPKALLVKLERAIRQDERAGVVPTRRAAEKF